MSWQGPQHRLKFFGRLQLHGWTYILDTNNILLLIKCLCFVSRKDYFCVQERTRTRALCRISQEWAVQFVLSLSGMHFTWQSHALVGGGGGGCGHAHPRIFWEWCNLVSFRVNFEEILLGGLPTCVELERVACCTASLILACVGATLLLCIGELF